MSPLSTPHNDISKHYATALSALHEIVHAYFFLGKLSNALSLAGTILPLTVREEVEPQERLAFLLLYGRVLTADHLIHRDDPALMLSITQQAKQVAEAAQLQQGSADALSLLGQAFCNVTTIATLKSGNLPFGPRDQEKYEDAFACYQQALNLLEAQHDARIMSEVLFGIGLIYQFWQQNEAAREHFTKAIQVAEQHGYVLEQAEPNRHLSVDALFRGDLDLALIHAQRALSAREAGGFKPYQPFDHLSLRDLYLKKGETARAEFHTRQATLLATEMGFADLVATTIDTTSRLGD